jgi:hypothetical protein
MNKLMVVALLLLCGCSAQTLYSNMSVGSVPCLASDIKISDSDYKFVMGISQWVAECGGDKYICSNSEIEKKTTCTKKVKMVEHVVDSQAECLKKKAYNPSLVCKEEMK